MEPDAEPTQTMHTQSAKADPPPAESEMDSWQRIELQRAQNWAGYSQLVEVSDSSPVAGTRPNLFDDPLGFIGHYADVAKNAVRGVAAFNLVRAAREINIQQVSSTLRITGSRAARNTIGFREMVNWVRPDNVNLVVQSPALRAVRSLKSWGVAFGIGLGLAYDTSEYLNGNYDRQEYAAALTIDTGITVGAALAAGAISGVVTGAIAGAVGGGIVVPIVGAIPGAVLGAVVGGIVGIVTAVGISLVIHGSGLRDSLIDSVTDLYRSWTNQPNMPEQVNP